MNGPVREAVVVWAAVIAGLAVAQILGLFIAPLGSLVGALAVAAFLYVPLRFLERRGEDAVDAGFRFDRLGQDLLWAAVVCAVVLPLFTLSFFAFTEWLDQLPGPLRAFLAPYTSHARPLHLHLPLTLDFAGQVAGNAAVAFSEEFFYRGYLTRRFEERWPPQRSFLGARLGRAAVLAAVLFALGHLLQPAPWRLAVFFPALIFAWLRAKTGTVVGGAIAHLAFNVSLLLLQGAAS